MAYKEAAKELLYSNSFINSLFNNIKSLFIKTNIIYSDSQSAIELSKNPNYHARTKHVDIRYYFIRELVKNKTIKFI